MKAFTLVELIVVITILAILWTMAFISLQDYSGERVEYRYQIKNDSGWYYTNYYKIDWSCINFDALYRNWRKTEMTACWEFNIIRLWRD